MACAPRWIPMCWKSSPSTGTPPTVCPLSNCVLNAFADLGSHNIRRLHEAGVCVTVSSDDPPYFGGYINANFAAVHGKPGMGDYALWEKARNSFTAAFCRMIRVSPREPDRFKMPAPHRLRRSQRP